MLCCEYLSKMGPMLKEETMAIKESLQDSSLDQLRASDGWLDTWKSAYTIKESRLVGVAEDVAEETITSWMERIQELREGYSSENIWNMDESGCFFFWGSVWQRANWERQRSEGWQKIQTKIHHSFFVNAFGEKMDEPVVIWKSKKPRCFKCLSDRSRPADLPYFSNPKSWMASDVMQAVLTCFNKKLLLEQRKVILILDNATCHPKSIIDLFLQIKIIFSI